MSFSTALAISDSSALKSKGSSVLAGEDGEDDSAREASRAALPPFLSKADVLVKERKTLGDEIVVVGVNVVLVVNDTGLVECMSIA